ncbi:hypothetical protein [uncultured Gimesia sp.]|uniref:hypothetical protein n=1 Tax=uncultured Gimesia sp. TaxID=1678688 RepID=UPI0030DA0254|tara:strand:+ start:48078 stop:48800 length:723 start_codon:yes stop_codon:yes gene_type:complete
MLARCCAVLLCLAGIHDQCRATDPIFDVDKKSKIETVQLTETNTLQFGPFSMQGKDLSVRFKSPDQKIITLSHDAQLLCGQTRFSANRIEVSYKDPQDLRMSLEGNVEIENERDQLRMFARNASLINHDQGRSLVLSSRDREHVTLLRTSDEKTIQIEASRIQLHFFPDLHTLRITPIDQVSIKVRPARLTDLVKVVPSAQSELDFFDGISITDVQLHSTKSPNQTRRTRTEAEKLQLLE